MIEAESATHRSLTALVALAAPLALGLTAAPAFAQEEEGQREKVRFVTVVGEEECPESTGDEIVVCNRYGEDEQYRIPKAQRGDPDANKNLAWSRRMEQIEAAGDGGALSCSSDGLGGYTGCTQEMIDRYYALKDRPSAGRASEIINAEREERLSDVDAAAEAEEARVQEAIARQEEMRRQREAAEQEEQERERVGDGTQDDLITPDDDLLDAEPE